MAQMLWRELIEIPTQVHKSDFVLRLTDGLARAQHTVKSYVVTEALADAFHKSLSMVHGALEDGTSKATYLHGSFGSGKSHFMAILDLLLDDTDNTSGVRNLKGLAPVLAEHQHWLGRRKLLMVPYHFIGATSMESAVLGGYVEFVKRRHPEASLPGVYVADGILSNAQKLRGNMGDEAFFKMLNKGAAAPVSSGWGAAAKVAGWNATSYAAAADAAPSDPSRARLVGDLVARVLTSVQDTARSQGSGFVSLDEGLSIVSRHAKTLGYDGLILFLDELVLWMASRAADLEFVHREGQKLSKLVEAQHADRPVPIISFVARQRDLRDFIGDAHTGSAISAFSDSLQWWEGRFDTITLEDRDLPLIASERLLKPKNASAAETIEQDFSKAVRRLRGAAKDVILTRDGDEQALRQVYPFSLALVQALVALSTFLQRERTALRLMLMLLVRQRNTLSLGALVPVGDLWDVVAEGEEPFSEEMRRPFQAARTLWDNKLRPMLVREYGFDPALDPEAGTPARRTLFCNDGRLLKTLLVAALVPNVEALRDMTAARLLALNPGAVRSALPGGERGVLVKKLRKWAGSVGELRVSDDSDPHVKLQLSSLDPEVLLAQVNHVDNTGERKLLIRKLLFGWLEIADDGNKLLEEHKLLWRGDQRLYRVRYQNVRQMTHDDMENHNTEWTLLLDYPFDDAEHSPSDDRARVQRFLDERPHGTRTVAWLPSFLSARGQEVLGRTVKIDYLLGHYDSYANTLPPAERPVMRQLLENQQSALRSELRRALEVAYGLSNDDVDTVDPARHLDTHLYSLWPGFDPRMPGGQDFAGAMRAVIIAGLEARYPKAPRLPDERTQRATRDKLADVLHDALHTPDRRLLVEEIKLRGRVKDYLPALGLGAMGETHFIASTMWRDTIERHLGHRDNVTVGDVRVIIEPPEAPTGTPRVFQDMIIMSYAWLEDMAPVRNGTAVKFEWGKLLDDISLVRRDLPDATAWDAALSHAVQIFGLNIKRRMRNAGNVESLGQMLKKAANSRRQAHEAVTARLHTLGEAMGLSRETLRGADRLQAAAALGQLLQSLQQPNKPELDTTASVRALANITDRDRVATFKAQLSALKDNQETLSGLDPNILKAGHQRETNDKAIGTLMDALRNHLQAHEHVHPLAKGSLQEHYKRLTKVLLDVPVPPPPPIKPPVSPGGTSNKGAQETVLFEETLNKANLNATIARLKKLVEEHDQALRLVVRLGSGEDKQ